MSPSPMVLVVANRRNQGLGRITRFWSSRVSLPSVSSTRWMTNITSGRPASYSSNTSATGCCSAQGSRPSRNSVTCWPSCRTIASRPIEVDAADVRVEVDADHRPVEPRRDLLDMGRLAGAVIALDHHPAVAREAGADRQRRVGIEHIGRVEVGNALVGLAERRALPCRCRSRTARAPSPSCRARRGRCRERLSGSTLGISVIANGLKRNGASASISGQLSAAFGGQREEGRRSAPPASASPSTPIESSGAPA